MVMLEREVWRKDVINRTGFSKSKVAAHIAGEREPSMEDRAKYAVALGLKPEDFEDRYQVLRGAMSGRASGHSTASGTLTNATPIVPAPKPRNPLDPNVDPILVETIRVPEFDLRIAAGPWIDVGDEAASPDNSYAVVQGRFRVRVRGDSMEPRWPDGSMIEFRRIVLGREHLPFGEDCYVQTADGRATFKRLESGDEDHIVLRAVNAAKYPKKMTVAVQEIVNVAVAESMIVVPTK